MRKLVVTEFLTADGVMEAPNEWHAARTSTTTWQRRSRAG